jgi:transposase InsO family protein
VALAVQEWIARRGFKTLYIKPGSPWQNAYSESFNSRFRDEFLNREAFGSVLEAKVLGKEHRHRHNHQRPHSSLAYQTPVEFAQRSLAAASATLRRPQGCALPTEPPLNNQPETNEKLS